MNIEENIARGWALIDGFPFHRVTIDGYIETRNIFGHANVKCEWRRPTLGKIGGGYAVVRIQHNKVIKSFIVHRLVASYFIEKIPGKNVVNHIDGNKKNNHFKNLEWMTREENQKHANDNNLICIGERNGRSKLTNEDIVKIRLRLDQGISKAKIAAMFNVSAGLIGHIKMGRNWTHVQ